MMSNEISRLYLVVIHITSSPDLTEFYYGPNNSLTLAEQVCFESTRGYSFPNKMLVRR